MRSPFDFQIVAGIPRWLLSKPIQAAAQVRKIYRPVFGANIVIDFSLGDIALIVATSNAAFTIANPLNGPGNEGTELTLMIANTSGGALGAITFGTQYKTAAGIAFPATGQIRTYDFYHVAGLAGAGNTFQQDSATADTPTPT